MFQYYLYTVPVLRLCLVLQVFGERYRTRLNELNWQEKSLP